MSHAAGSTGSGGRIGLTLQKRALMADPDNSHRGFGVHGRIEQEWTLFDELELVQQIYRDEPALGAA